MIREGFVLGFLAGGLMIAVFLVLRLDEGRAGGLEAGHTAAALRPAPSAPHPASVRAPVRVPVRETPCALAQASADRVAEGPVPVPCSEETLPPSGPPTLATPEVRALLEPTPAAIERLEAATAARDPRALLRLLKDDRSLVRFEALRRYGEVAGPEGLGALRDVLEGADDPALASLLGDAFGAGGTADDAEALAARLHTLRGPARLAVARATIEIAQRVDVSPACATAAVEALEALARGPEDVAASDEALLELAMAGPEGAQALARLASDRGLDEGVRRLACEQLPASLALELASDLAR